MKGVTLGIAIAAAAAAAAACGNDKSGPAADCQLVGKYAASFELGNYAPVEDRAPTEARFVAACRDVGVNQKQGACLMAAKDVWTAAACAPKLFPDIKVDGDCGVIAARLGDGLRKQMGASGDPKTLKMIDRMIAAVRTSCDQDGWPKPLKACFLSATDMMKDAERCQKLIPPELMTKLQGRMSSVMQ